MAFWKGFFTAMITVLVYRFRNEGVKWKKRLLELSKKVIGLSNLGRTSPAMLLTTLVC